VNEEDSERDQEEEEDALLQSTVDSRSLSTTPCRATHHQALVAKYTAASTVLGLVKRLLAQLGTDTRPFHTYTRERDEGGMWGGTNKQLYLCGVVSVPTI